MSKIKSRLDCLKKDYKDVKFLRDNSGFGWNDDLGLPTAPNEVWTAIINSNSNCKKFRTTPFPLFDSLTVLFDGSYADGRFCLTPPNTSNSFIGEGTISRPRVSIQRKPQRVAASDIDDSSDLDSDDLTPPPKKMKQQIQKEIVGVQEVLLEMQFRSLWKSKQVNYNSMTPTTGCQRPSIAFWRTTAIWMAPSLPTLLESWEKASMLQSLWP
ncbi:hypothetical protein Ae201684_013897 [Aphanomyces euteiches]|uniref:Myb/SANT-like domain-containing protein n=1 Tax=Aphanomyces euteiches TaxID=100861 RepID=A0A6G0WLT3_9STRA|nr:hypothetical protein Ae201684_013897 [Aphanomyces euteiches]